MQRAMSASQPLQRSAPRSMQRVCRSSTSATLRAAARSIRTRPRSVKSQPLSLPHVSTAMRSNRGFVKGELAYPACNHDGLQLAAVKSPALVAACLLGSEMKTLLNAGITPLAPSFLNPGYAQVVKSITTYCRTTSNALTRAVHDTSKVTVADAAGDRVEERVLAEFAGKNIAPEPTPYRAPRNENVVYLSMIRTSIPPNSARWRTKTARERR